MDMVKTIGEAGIVPVIVVEDVEKAVPLAKALVAGGLPVLEVTFRTACAAEAIARMKAQVSGATLIAGTVLTPRQLVAARDAGAEACVAPGFDPEVVRTANAIGMPFCPGVATASELSQALALGCRMVKFFPAESAGGVKYIKDLLGAFRWTGVKFMPTGGVSAANVQEYLADPHIIACGGSWMVKGDLIKAGKFDEIEQMVREAAAIVKEIRG